MNRRENNLKLIEHKTQILLFYLQLSRKLFTTTTTTEKNEWDEWAYSYNFFFYY